MSIAVSRVILAVGSVAVLLALREVRADRAGGPVGFVNLDVRPGYQIIANPIQPQCEETVARVFRRLPEGTPPINFTGGVFATNLVGFVNLDVRPGYQLVANPFQPQREDTVARVFRRLPVGTQLIKYAEGRFTTNSVWASEFWEDPTQTFGAGEAGFLFNPLTNIVTLTLDGQMLVGEIVTPIPAGLSLLGCKAPLQGRVTQDMHLRLSSFDNLYLWKETNFIVYTYLPNGHWHPAEPRLGPAEGFFVRTAQPTNWIINLNP